MFRKILIPTDGSAVARKAVNGGVAFAKAIDAAVVAYCATEPIERIYYAEGSGARPATVKALERRYVEQAQRYLDEIAKKARAGGRHLRDGHHAARHAVPGDPGRGAKPQMRRDLHVVAWPRRHRVADSGQRYPEGARAFERSGHRLPVTRARL